jgi:hypothetical protein
VPSLSAYTSGNDLNPDLYCTQGPSIRPSRQPTPAPSRPTTRPTIFPTLAPTAPTLSPTSPTGYPTVSCIIGRHVSSTPRPDECCPSAYSYRHSHSHAQVRRLAYSCLQMSLEPHNCFHDSVAPTLQPTASSWPVQFLEVVTVFKTDTPNLNVTWHRSEDLTYYMEITSRGLPNHAYVDTSLDTLAAIPDDGRRRLQNGRRLLASLLAEQAWKYNIPLEPRPVASKPFQDEYDPMTLLQGKLDSPIGFAINGVPFFGPLSKDGADVVQPPPGGSGAAFDACMGSISSSGAYNYRVMPPCLFGMNSQGFDMVFTKENVLQAYSPLIVGSPSPLLGYALDGFPIYGPYDADGQLHKGLDNCNGKFLLDGSYAYFATPTFPYTLGCFGPGQTRRAPSLPAALEAEEIVEVDGELPYNGEIDASLDQADRDDMSQVLYSDTFADPTSATGYIRCAEGMFRSARTSSCELCPAGRYGLTASLTSATCSGECPKGHYCPPGTSYPTANKCPAGRYGARQGLTGPECSGPCQEGYFCPAGATSPR